MKVDVASADLLACHRAHGVDCSAFLSACNPGGRLQCAADNAAAHARLRELLRTRGYAVLAGFGADPAGEWPGEASWLVPGVGLDEARKIGRAFGQHGILYAGVDAVPRLVLLDDLPPRPLSGAER
jgi:hypothetical protein